MLDDKEKAQYDEMASTDYYVNKGRSSLRSFEMKNKKSLKKAKKAYQKVMGISVKDLLNNGTVKYTSDEVSRAIDRLLS